MECLSYYLIKWFIIFEIGLCNFFLLFFRIKIINFFNLFQQNITNLFI